MQDRYRQIDELSCDARPDHTLRSIAPTWDVRAESVFTPTAAQ